jgi:outer membrane protein assembly factor BamB
MLYVGVFDKYMTDPEAFFYGIRKENGEIVWKIANQYGIGSAARYSQGRIYYGSWDNHLYAVY